MSIIKDPDRFAASNIECLKICCFVRQHEHVRVHNVGNVDEISSLPAIFVNNQWQLLHRTSEEDAADPGIVIVQRLTWALRNGVS